MSPADRNEALTDEPIAVGRVEDAYLAALAEYLTARDRLSDAPAWTEKPERFLREPFFAGGLESLKAILVESPSAFRRRLIFISADGLSRPHRAMLGEG
jgi:hypothetical protein